MDAWDEMDNWCREQAAIITRKHFDYIMAGNANLECPLYRAELGQHRAFMRMRSYIHGAIKAGKGFAREQEPLGSDFEAIWDANIESLYEA